MEIRNQQVIGSIPIVGSNGISSLRDKAVRRKDTQGSIGEARGEYEQRAPSRSGVARGVFCVFFIAARCALELKPPEENGAPHRLSVQLAVGNGLAYAEAGSRLR